MSTKNSESDELYAPTCQPISLRDWFAGQALAGLLSSPPPRDGESWTGEYRPQMVAECSYAFADAMLVARTKTDETDQAIARPAATL